MLARLLGCIEEAAYLSSMYAVHQTRTLCALSDGRHCWSLALSEHPRAMASLTAVPIWAGQLL